MLIAIISDIHANLEALQTCLKKIGELKPDKVVCLGDLVDYCAQPNECVELVKNHSDVVVMGNHDEAQLKYEIAEDFSEHAYISSLHTRDIINPEHVEYFKTLPYAHSEEDLLFVHGSPRTPEEYDYVLNNYDAAINFISFKEKICFIGHSHLPIIFEETNEGIRTVEPRGMSSANRYIINVGSVGQPRDGNYRLCFGLFDTDKFTFEYIRLDYNREAASRKIIREGLPLFLAERILVGV